MTEGLAGRRAALGAALGERFPGIRDLVLSGELSDGLTLDQARADAPADLVLGNVTRLSERGTEPPQVRTLDPPPF